MKEYPICPRCKKQTVAGACMTSTEPPTRSLYCTSGSCYYKVMFEDLTTPILMKKYQIIYADPPWRFKNWSMSELAKRGEKWARKNGRSPYNVMDNADIYKLPVQEITDKDCILFLWATYPKLQEALETIRIWGFIYKTVAFTWVKQNKVSNGFHFGLGYWTRGNPEICLLATKGKIKRQSKSVANLQISHLRGHSQKPDNIRDEIMQLVGDLPRIELFARQKTEGWDTWGNQCPCDIEL